VSIEENTKLLIEAAQIGNPAEVERLISISDPQFEDSKALICAAAAGHPDCVKLLIPVSDLKANNSKALELSAFNGHADCVELLIPVSDPKADNSSALQNAAGNNHQSCIDVLYSVSDPHAALHQLQHDYPDDVSIWGDWNNGLRAIKTKHCAKKFLRQKRVRSHAKYDTMVEYIAIKS